MSLASGRNAGGPSARRRKIEYDVAPAIAFHERFTAPGAPCAFTTGIAGGVVQAATRRACGEPARPAWLNAWKMRSPFGVPSVMFPLSSSAAIRALYALPAALPSAYDVMFWTARR